MIHFESNRAQAVEGALMSEKLLGMDEKQLKAVVDERLSKWTNPSFWDATLLQPLLLDVIRERLEDEESELLGKVRVCRVAVA